MYQWTRAFFQLQIGVLMGMALLVSLLPLAGRLSGTGRQIAFESDRDGNWEIYLMDIDRQIAQNLTRSPDQERSPAWSSDGSRLAYYSSDNTGLRASIYAMELANGDIHKLTANDGNNWMPAWSPDGQYIAYVVNNGGLIIANSDGSDPRRISYGFHPSWSLDSRRVVYYADRRETLNADIYDIDVESLRIRNLSLNRANDFDPALSPDGLWLAFASARDASADIYVMAVCDDDHYVECSRAAQPITRNEASDVFPAWSPDSRQIAFTSDSGKVGEIFIIDRDGGNLRNLTGAGSNNRSPAWRPQ